MSVVDEPERMALSNNEQPAGSTTDDVIAVEGLLRAFRGEGSGRPCEPQGATDVTSAARLQRGVMSPPRSAEPARGLMPMRSRPSRGLMEPDPSAPPFDWSRDGIRFLWLIAFVLALVLEIGHITRGTTRGVGDNPSAAVGGLAKR